LLATSFRLTFPILKAHLEEGHDIVHASGADALRDLANEDVIEISTLLACVVVSAVARCRVTQDFNCATSVARVCRDATLAYADGR
jgi:hypothetical protein